MFRLLGVSIIGLVISSTSFAQQNNAKKLTHAETVGLTPAISIAQTRLANSQAQGMLFANMVQSQQQQSMANSATMTRSVSQVLGKRTQMIQQKPRSQFSLAPSIYKIMGQ